MIREIRFRGKRIDNGEWIYSDESYVHTEAGVFIGSYNEEKQVDPATVGQYTGLHDRTGKEVYEGDVVFWIAIDMRGRGKGEQGTIIWDKPTMAWAIMRDKPTSDGRPCIISRPFDKKHLEVVGNIHDNPELLEGGEI